MTFERAAILTEEARAQFENIWAKAPTPPSTWSPDQIEEAMTTLALHTLQAVCAMGD